MKREREKKRREKRLVNLYKGGEVEEIEMRIKKKVKEGGSGEEGRRRKRSRRKRREGIL